MFASCAGEMHRNRYSNRASMTLELQSASPQRNSRVLMSWQMQASWDIGVEMVCPIRLQKLGGFGGKRVSDCVC